MTWLPTAATVPAYVAQDLRLRASPSADGALEPRGGATPGAVVAVDGRGADADEDVVRRGDGAIDLLDAQDLGWAVSVQHDGPHARGRACLERANGATCV